MRICMLTLDTPPHSGAATAQERQALAAGLARRGHDVWVVTCGREPGRRTCDSVHILEVPAGPARSYTPNQPDVDSALTHSQALYEGFAALHEEQPFDIVDTPLWQAQGFVTLTRFRPAVVWLPAGAPPHGRSAARTLLALEQQCLDRAAGVVGEPGAIARARASYRIDPALPALVLRASPLQPPSAHEQDAAGRAATDSHQSPGVREQEHAAPADEIIAFYERVLAHSHRRTARANVIYQVMETLDVGDAVSNITRSHAQGMADLGQPPAILARYTHPSVTKETLPLRQVLAQPDCGLIFHYWNYNSSAWVLHATRGPKALYYHNITPPEYFPPDSSSYEQSSAGYAQLRRILPLFDIIVGDSRYNLLSCAPYLTRPVPSMPIYPIVEPETLWNTPYDTGLYERLRAPGETNFLFVGRIAPNKRQDQLIRLFDHYYRTINRHARLWLVGNTAGYPAYLDMIVELKRSLPAGDRVMLPGKVDEAEMHAYFRAADVFVCASAHEGFCVPLAQAMALDIPVLAYRSSAIPETLGDGGLLVHEWDPPRVAELMHLAASDPALRARLITTQRRALARFSAGEARARLTALVRYLTDGAVSPLFETLAPLAPS